MKLKYAEGSKICDLYCNRGCGVFQGCFESDIGTTCPGCKIGKLIPY